VTHLRKMMLEELQRRNYAETTIDCYLHAVEDFSRHFNCSPDRLGPRHIREYQAALFQKRKFSPNTVAQRLAALRFFYVKTLKKAWSITETPYPKVPGLSLVMRVSERSERCVQVFWTCFSTLVPKLALSGRYRSESIMEYVP